jgi:hypothetical protein
MEAGSWMLHHNKALHNSTLSAWKFFTKHNITAVPHPLPHSTFLDSKMKMYPKKDFRKWQR